MSNIGIIRPEVAADIGNFMVGRLLPFRQKRAIGPFVFIDHMGPAALKDYENLDVGPHPHIGLSTLTYLFEGSIQHKDSLGSDIEIKPGAVNWMTAGKGVVHSERTPEYLRTTDKNLHGLQIWVALPKALEDCDPSFTHIEAKDIPEWSVEGVHYKLIAGSLMGYESPVPTYSPLYMLEIITKEDGAVINLGAHLFGESGLYILQGAIKSEGNTFEDKQILIANDSKLCSFEMMPHTSVYIFGGDAFPEEHFIYWNFVHTDRAVIEQAKDDWTNQRFPKVPGETTFVPLPPQNPNFKPKSS